VLPSGQPPAMPEIAVHKHCHLLLGEDDVGTTGQRVRTWRLNCMPWARNSSWTNFSSDPSLSFTHFIARERCSGVRWSAIRGGPLRQCSLTAAGCDQSFFAFQGIRDKSFGSCLIILDIEERAFPDYEECQHLCAAALGYPSSVTPYRSKKQPRSVRYHDCAD
jgi:hypothetical protein